MCWDSKRNVNIKILRCIEVKTFCSKITQSTHKPEDRNAEWRVTVLINWLSGTLKRPMYNSLCELVAEETSLQRPVYNSLCEFVAEESAHVVSLL